MIGYGGNSGDCGEGAGLYHGWVVSVLESGASLKSFEVAKDSGGGAVWGAGAGLPVDSAGNVWAETGNSPGPPFEHQESVVRLDAEMNLLDSWAPSNWQSLDGGDVDLGSTEPALLPGGLVFAIGKEGVGYLLSTAALGGTGAAPVFQAGVCGGSFGGGIVVSGVIYVTCTDGIRALSLDTQASTFASLGSWNTTRGAIGPPIYAGGLIWSAGWRDGNLYGLDPRTGNVTFSTNLGAFNHFATPAAGGGLLFVANDDKVTALRITNTPIPTPIVPPPGPPPGLRWWCIRRRSHGAGLSGSGAARTLRLTLSKSATLTATITQRVGGRRVRGRCRIGARHGRRCALTVRRARFTLRGHAGANSFRLALGRLRAGTYTVAVSAVDGAGLHSKTTQLALTIKQQRRRHGRRLG